LVQGVRFALELLTTPRVTRARRELFVADGRLVASLNRRTTWNGLKARAIVSLLDRPWLRRALLGKALVDPTALLNDQGQLRDFTLKLAQPQFHVCGTARMGHSDDPNAVVDEAGRVHGVKNLVIADASIFPTLPSAYTHFVVLMAAEKIADAIVSGARRSQVD